MSAPLIRLDRFCDRAEDFDWRLPCDTGLDPCGADLRLAREQGYVGAWPKSLEERSQISGRVASRPCPHCVMRQHLTLNPELDLMRYVRAFGRRRDGGAIVRHPSAVINFVPARDIEYELAQLQHLIACLDTCRTPAFAWLAAIIFLRIHPYPDGNGRAARNLAILLMLKWRQISTLSFPLYLLLRATGDEIVQRLNALHDETDLVQICLRFHEIHRDSMVWMSTSRSAKC